MAANTSDSSILVSQSKPNRFMSPSSVDLSSLVKMTFNHLVLPTIRTLELEDLISSNKEPPNQFMIIQSSDNLSMESILQLIHQLQTLKKGSSYMSNFVMKIKGIGDEPKTAD
ncbi:hypothetical protein ACOSP7_016147 [Xanthoceras sorbifolium]